VKGEWYNEGEMVSGEWMSLSRNMKRTWQGVLAIALPLTLYSLLTACAIPHVPSRIVYEDPVNYVRLEEDKNVLPEWPQSHFSHPATVSKEVLWAILSGLKVQEHRTSIQRWLQGEAPLVPVFNNDELVMLSAELAEGLAQAEYNERVTFYLSEPLTFSRRTITSGGIYVQGTELHILIGNWRVIYGVPAYGMIYDRRYPMRPTAAKGFDLFFEPAEAIIPQKSSLMDDLLANTKDELVIDISKIEDQKSASAVNPF
jgi:hypothetical protein